MRGKPIVMIGDVREQLRLLPDNSIHCAVTSPPYYGLRDYKIPSSTWSDGWVGCLGNEPRLDMYVAHLIEVFRELYRVLRPDATFWLNLGDSYANGGRKWRDGDKKLQQRGMNNRPSDPDGVKPKDLLGVPWMVAFALRNDGWYLRAENIWHKTSPMPESVQDRTTRAHEQVFMLSKGKKYYYDPFSISEPAVTVGDTRHLRNDTTVGPRFSSGGRERTGKPQAPTRNARSVWTIGPEPFPGSHFAVFPSEIPRKAILAGTSELGVCPECRSPWTRRVVKKYSNAISRSSVDAKQRNIGMQQDRPHRTYEKGLGTGKPYATIDTIGWFPSCKCDSWSVEYIDDVSVEAAETGERPQKMILIPGPGGIQEPIPATIIDPFAGSGTSLAVATVLNRNSIGIDLDGRLEGWLPERTEAIRKRFVKHGCV